MYEEGYHNVSAIYIAKYDWYLQVLFYQYFNDKIDIFIVSVRDYADTIMFPI